MGDDAEEELAKSSGWQQLGGYAKIVGRGSGPGCIRTYLVMGCEADSGSTASHTSDQWDPLVLELVIGTDTRCIGMRKS